MNRPESSATILQRAGIDRLLDAPAAAILADAFTAAEADEGTLWLADPEGTHLVAHHNSGPDARRIVGFAQPVGRGIISMVFETEQAFCENDMERNTTRDATLDRRIGKTTRAMIAVPFVIRGETCGVVSCVRLDNPESCPKDFDGRDLDAVVRAVGDFQNAVEATCATLVS